jgi:hypothetical protein
MQLTSFPGDYKPACMVIVHRQVKQSRQPSGIAQDADKTPADDIPCNAPPLLRDSGANMVGAIIRMMHLCCAQQEARSSAG